ncbi:putative retrotransposon hot spot (RHS) protein, partial [Trypanosoma conorhini]
MASAVREKRRSSTAVAVRPALHTDFPAASELPSRRLRGSLPWCTAPASCGVGSASLVCGRWPSPSLPLFLYLAVWLRVSVYAPILFCPFPLASLFLAGGCCSAAAQASKCHQREGGNSGQQRLQGKRGRVLEIRGEVAPLECRAGAGAGRGGSRSPGAAGAGVERGGGEGGGPTSSRLVSSRLASPAAPQWRAIPFAGGEAGAADRSGRPWPGSLDTKEQKKPEVGRRLLIGTPGIGKSMTAGSYLLYQLLHHDAAKLQVVVYCFGRGIAFLLGKSPKAMSRFPPLGSG